MKPLLIDLYCGAGGASEGYHRAGWRIIGVDIKPQPRYPFEFIRADALMFDLSAADAVHASPPCQFATLLKHAPGGRDHPNLIPATRERLLGAGVPYVIENVEPARAWLRDPILLCGTMFGLKAQGCELRRHRLFQCSFPISPPACAHTDGPVIGVYGGHARRRAAKHGGRGTKDVWIGGHSAACAEAMDMEGCTLNEMSEAIPPPYTEFIGRAMLKYLNRAIAA